MSPMNFLNQIRISDSLFVIDLIPSGNPKDKRKADAGGGAEGQQFGLPGHNKDEAVQKLGSQNHSSTNSEDAGAFNTTNHTATGGSSQQSAS